MAKYTRDLDEALQKKAKSIAVELGINSYGIKVEVVGIVKPTATYGEVLKPNEMVKLFTGNENMICIALNEEMFSRFDEDTQRILIENLLTQISYDPDKEKINVNKPEISYNLYMLHQYKGVIADKLELVHLTQQQIIEEEKAKKQQKNEK